MVDTNNSHIYDFFTQYPVYNFRKRQIILQAHTIPPGVFFIKKGYVRSYVVSKDGKELTTNILKPSHIFPLQWVVNNTAIRSAYQALTDVSLSRASKEDFLDFLQQNPAELFYFMSKTLKRLREASRRLETVLLGTAFEKVGNILVFLAENLGVQKNKQTVIQVPFTHQEISDMIGLTRETTSIELEKLQKEGLIIQKDHLLVIQDINTLKAATSLT